MPAIMGHYKWTSKLNFHASHHGTMHTWFWYLQS